MRGITEFVLSKWLIFSLLFFIVWIVFNGYPEGLQKPDELFNWIIRIAAILISAVCALVVILGIIVCFIKSEQ